MSSASRSTPRGGKGAKQERDGCKAIRNDTKVETPKSLDHNPKIQPTAEQMRIAQIIDTRTDDPGLKDKIRQVMDATRKTEDEVCTALHDCDNDLEKAVNMLLEGMAQGEWETSVKKKKSRQPPAGATKSDSAADNQDQEDWDQEPSTVNPERERSRTRGGGPPRMRGRGSLDNRGWRGRENKENERNLDEGRGEGYRRGGGRMTSGPGRSGRGGRGGGRLGPRTFQSRDKQEDSSFPRSIDTWNNPGAEESSGETLKMEKWGDDFPSPEDWDNEEYTGSLADTKVFTPSGGSSDPAPASDPAHDLPSAELSTSLNAQLSSSLTSSTSQMSQSLEMQQPSPSQISQPWLQSPAMGGVSSRVLTAAQSDYLTRLASESLKSAVGIGSSPGGGGGGGGATAASAYGAAANSSYQPPTSSTVFQPSAAQQQQSPPSAYTATSAAYSASNYAAANSYGGQMQDDAAAGLNVAQMPARAKALQRPRVPPPSKIPSSAVEMPGDVAYLDVQFGGLEFSETGSFEPPGLEQAKYSNNVTASSVLDSMPAARPASNMDLTSQSQSSIDSYSTSQKTNNQNSIASQMNQVQNLTSSGGDSLLSGSEHKSRDQSYSQSRGGQSHDMDKSDIGLSYSATSTPSYQVYQNQKAASTGYQPTPSYSSSNYASNAVTTSTTSYPANQSQMSYAATGSSYSNPPAAANSYQNNSYSQSSGTSSGAYQSAQTSYPSISQASAFSGTNPSSYQGNSQSVYGSSTGLGSTGYAPASTGQYQNNYGTATTAQQNHAKLSSVLSTTTKEAQYDATTTMSTSNLNSSASLSGANSSVNASPSLGSLSGGAAANQQSASGAAAAQSTKGSAAASVAAAGGGSGSTTGGGKGGVVPNMPPGVPPMQYIMSQTGLPFYQQPAPMYSYEDLQLMQQRIPHMPTGYYDMTFQAPTSLATGRDAGLPSVAYSMSDGRFARADNNASPVPAALSQQQNASQAHTQPMLNASGLPPGYTYYIQGGMVPGGFQYGAPAIYPMSPAANAHGTASSTQYGKPGSGYGTGYGSGYDNLSQSQDYGKAGGYVSSNQSQSKAGGVGGSNAGSSGSSSTDLSGTMMYGKSHVSLGKVNSYEKQGFHSGTPPPFNLTASQNTAMAQSGAYAPQMFIPTMPPHQQQHHSTTLMHQPPHQESGGSSNQRQSSTQANKSGAKQGYNPSYWAGP